jgi:hypothetical protein
MTIRTLDFSIDPVDGASRDAVEGFCAIAAALDQGLVDGSCSHRGKFLDNLAIGIGWAVLVAVIFYPGLQLAAIAVCSGLMVVRSLFRLLLRANPAEYRQEFAERPAVTV